MGKTYIRQDAHRYSKFGRGGRKNKIKWRRPKGKHSKMRRFRKSYPARPNLGEATPSKLSGKIQGMTPVLIHNIKELTALSKTSIAIIARIGAKKKIELMKKASELNIKVVNGGKQ